LREPVPQMPTPQQMVLLNQEEAVPAD
jgi:hypothetical protein